MIVQADARRIPLSDGSVHMIVTSPPYWNAREYSSWPTYEGYLVDMAHAWEECFRVLCDGGRIAVNINLGYGRPGQAFGYILIGDDTARALCAAGFALRGHIVWNKSNGTNRSGATGTGWGSWRSASDPCLRDAHEVIIVAHKGRANRGDGESTISAEDFMEATNSVWNIVPASQSWHPAPFPDEIPRRLIELYTFRGDVVLDPFLGSGTTARVAAALGRRGIGLELNWGYARRSIDRLPQLRLLETPA